jgi:hypothetical protein
MDDGSLSYIAKLILFIIIIILGGVLSRGLFILILWYKTLTENFQNLTKLVKIYTRKKETLLGTSSPCLII